MNTSPVQTIIRTLHGASKRKSWVTLNQALHSTLESCILTGIPFRPDDITALQRFTFHRWCHNGGEGLYASACGAGRNPANISAAVALENWLERPPYYWAEDSATADRLYVGKDFTWEGEMVCVTSMGKDRLVACSYHDVHRAAIKHLYKISHAELTAKRKEHDRRRQAYEAEFAAATSEETILDICRRASAEGRRAYRHFDLELLLAAAKAALERVDLKTAPALDLPMLIREVGDRRQIQQGNLEQWLQGVGEENFFGGRNYLRVKGGRVEVSNGNSVSLKAAHRTMGFALLTRGVGWSDETGDSHAVDTFRLKKVDAAGVTIGCTFIEWTEIERFRPILEAAVHCVTA